jgi:cystathionine gamma-synthase
MDSSSYRLGTQAVWAGEHDGEISGTVSTPIVNSVAFSYSDPDEWQEVATGQKAGYIYSRNNNPTVRVLEEKIRVLEGADAATSFSTGMAAISNTLFALLKPGDRVVSIKDTYGGASRIFIDFLPRFGIEVKLCDTLNNEQLTREIAAGCQVVYLETPTNPTLKILDLRQLSAAAKKAGAVVVVDNTFATPVNQRPLHLGVDLVVHSATKFLCGHSDAMGGVLCGSSELVGKVFRFREINGASLQADPAYLIARGMKTLELRVQRQNQSAMMIATFLKNHPRVSSVFYPGLETHPGHVIAKSQMKGFGGVLSFSLDGSFEHVKKLLRALKLAHLAATLGSVSTLAGPPRTTSHVELTEEQRKALGIPESLIRYSVGIENAEDLLEDLSSALSGL